MKISREELASEKVPLPFRDYCAHLLVPLNKCRVEHYYLPWKCTQERHVYEECQRAEYLRRVKQQLEAEKKK
jgi:NADH dehydrogenase (ubiquinone) 1 beta subcomplex subunit 7